MCRSHPYNHPFIVVQLAHGTDAKASAHQQASRTHSKQGVYSKVAQHSAACSCTPLGAPTHPQATLSIPMSMRQGQCVAWLLETGSLVHMSVKYFWPSIAPLLLFPFVLSLTPSDTRVVDYYSLYTYISRPSLPPVPTAYRRDDCRRSGHREAKTRRRPLSLTWTVNHYYFTPTIPSPASSRNPTLNQHKCASCKP